MSVLAAASGGTSLLAIVGGLGGGVTFIGALFILMRGIFGQIHATQDNTRALDELRAELKAADGRADDHERRISRLEGKAGG